MTTRCRSCNARVTWARHHVTGKVMPIDAEPSLNGNVLLSRDNAGATFKTLTPLELTIFEGALLHTSHFATCPEADKWRRS